MTDTQSLAVLEAAKRFERGTDPDITVVALARAAALLAEYGGATVVDGPVDVDTRAPRPEIALAADRPERTAGIPISTDQVIDALRTVGATVSLEGDRLLVGAPAP